jgi:hypothetical protein
MTSVRRPDVSASAPAFGVSRVAHARRLPRDCTCVSVKTLVSLPGLPKPERGIALMNRGLIRQKVPSSTAGEIADREGSSGMNGLDDTTTTNTAPTRRACLVAGCACKDARIVSHRRAAYFARLARSNGETANRFIGAEDDWRLPTTANTTSEGAIE